MKHSSIATLIISLLLTFFQPSSAHASAPVLLEDSSSDQDRALQCLTLAIAYEAGFEPQKGQQAVAEVILNRTQHPAYPKSVCGVVFQGSSRKTGCQFTFTCDGAMQRKLSDSVMMRSRQVAEGVLLSQQIRHVGGATHYHADYVTPYWASSLIRVTKIGAHIFYRAPNASDTSARYFVRAEPRIDALGAIAFARDEITQKPQRIIAPKARPIAVQNAPIFAPWGLAPPMAGQ